MKLSSNELRILKFNYMKRGLSEKEAESAVAKTIREVAKVNRKIHEDKIKAKSEKKKDTFKDEFKKLTKKQ